LYVKKYNLSVQFLLTSADEVKTVFLEYYIVEKVRNPCGRL